MADHSLAAATVAVLGAIAAVTAGSCAKSSFSAQPAVAEATVARTASADAAPECWIRGDPSRLPFRASPFDSTEITLDAGTIKVCYSRARRLDRTIMGGLVIFGEPWRLGADEATAIYVSAPASIADIALDPGWYTLYAIPGPKEWELVVNAATERWGIPINDDVRAQDIGSTIVAVEETDSLVEMLTLSFERTAPNAARLIIEWETTRVSLPIRLTQ